MFDMESQSTTVKLVVESADSGIEAANSTADSAIIPLKIGLWVWALMLMWAAPITADRWHCSLWP